MLLLIDIIIIINLFNLVTPNVINLKLLVTCLGGVVSASQSTHRADKL